MDSLAAHFQGSHLGDAAIRIQFAAIKFLELVTGLGVGDRLITGIFAWCSAGVTCALNVVLSAQWIDPASFASEVACNQREIAQTLDVIHATDVFGDAERVIDGSFVCSPVHDGGLLDILCRYTGDLGGPLRGELFNMLNIFVDTACAFGDELMID